MDDEHSLRFNIFYRRNRPVTDSEKRLDEEFTPDFRKLRNIRNDYLIDRAEQKRETFIGVGKAFVIHDSCATETMAPRYDRSKEHLGISDITVIALRKRLLGIVRALDTGGEPPHLIRKPEQNDMRHIACIVTTIRSSTDPKQHIAELLNKEKYWEGSYS